MKRLLCLSYDECTVVDLLLHKNNGLQFVVPSFAFDI